MKVLERDFSSFLFCVRVEGESEGIYSDYGKARGAHGNVDTWKVRNMCGVFWTNDSDLVRERDYFLFWTWFFYYFFFSYSRVILWKSETKWTIADNWKRDSRKINLFFFLRFGAVRFALVKQPEIIVACSLFLWAITSVN